jgi:hypothetical protein
MKIELQIAQEDYGYGISKKSMIRWLTIFFFFELIIPFLMDPLDLDHRVFGLLYEDVYDIGLIIIGPCAVYYSNDLESGYGYAMGLFFYIVVCGILADFHFVYQTTTNDVLSMLIVFGIILETFIDEEEEEL